MRDLINIVEGSVKYWWDYPIKSIDDLAALRDIFVSHSGCDPDYDAIHDLIPNYLGDDDDLNAFSGAFFDHLIREFKRESKNGNVRAYRRISVKNLDNFIKGVSAGKKPLGNHWSHNEDAASTQYHCESPLDHDVLLIADVPVTSIDWGSSLEANFNHPHEQELFVAGPVKLVAIVNDDEVVATPNITVKA